MLSASEAHAIKHYTVVSNINGIWSYIPPIDRLKLKKTKTMK